MNRTREERLPKAIMKWKPTETWQCGQSRETWIKGIKRAIMSLRTHKTEIGWTEKSGEKEPEGESHYNQAFRVGIGKAPKYTLLIILHYFTLNLNIICFLKYYTYNFQSNDLDLHFLGFIILPPLSFFVIVLLSLIGSSLVVVTVILEHFLLKI